MFNVQTGAVYLPFNDLVIELQLLKVIDMDNLYVDTLVRPNTILEMGQLLRAGIEILLDQWY
ncbi:hypothetical protein DPMN_158683 [Dreissena polymorpha]|uniref:Uncharacterized protein n=1 Tax=Dreissena polymorpha TaxID=45954 RepID=A0A9D4IQ09_DREPO|nr:hypothetical protein DPMN_158683 [Dreissena polymorpha]